ncbi:ATP-dependent RNA helicase DEAH11, chloroplastic-like [Humulus lupulus]|uniref:ATP-dependent RNA helicase DEAH11, chloroplastic-like n=1 Tax=Humulus lupulus TaxID=3486 RepID=UPI002B416A76|nr:ATP-dependent RNA helicase DEAH11, chloroplastic-like [Humulus lupulus]
MSMNNSMGSFRPSRPPENHRRCHPPSTFHSLPNRRHQFPANHRLHRPVAPTVTRLTPVARSNFVVDILRDQTTTGSVTEVQALVDQCLSKPESIKVYQSGGLVASLFFRKWVDALEVVVFLWKSRLDGAHRLMPKLNTGEIVPSARQELEDRLRAVFAESIGKLIDGDKVKHWSEKRDHLSIEINKSTGFLRKPRGLIALDELREKKKRLILEMELVDKRLKEFKSAMRCMLAYLEGKGLKEYNKDDIQVLRLDGGFNWSQIHSLMLRECKRLEDGLPIYAYRQGILHHIHSQQIMVLIGETGSGKSTQLVQFLADSGITADEAIVCTQPRKIAATSLASRVREESGGCYGDQSITCYPSFSSDQQFNSKVIFTTDHCLLQHYMLDKNMSKISCLIVDEAHERSLNTDLLLSLVKSLLCRRRNLRLIIMSATVDAHQLSNYFFGCRIFHVVGRNFPVDITYIPCTTGAYVSDVVRMATEIHKTEKEGAILAFLTSQSEVELACEKFVAPNAVALPLHGKLSFEEQFYVFQNYPGKRKIIFSTNLAETSLTIPGVKYVIDCGMVKESKFEPGSGMNVLRVCRISQSSANQRAGRAGRTEPGRCYRLYSESDFKSMPPCQEPEIRRVHLGVAVLRIFALGIKNVQDFDFVDAPSAEAIEMAVRNLIQLSAIKRSNDNFELTDEGRCLVKMGIEPRLGKLILGCFSNRLGREGIVLAAVMANSSSIFCRVGTDEEKMKSDCIKVKFCHQDGDLFTLLSVYKEWEAVPRDKKNQWCWENSINAKTMRRCYDTVVELESCLERELTSIIPSYWRWNPRKSTDSDMYLKKVILSSLSENVAMYSGNDQLGYEVALTGQHVLLHPSCSLLVYGQKPNWVVFSEILSSTCQYLVCVTSFDFDSLSTLHPPPLFDASKIMNRKLQVKVLNGFGGTLLKKFCGKGNSNMLSLVARIRETCMDERIGIKVNVDQNEISVFATTQDMERVLNFVKGFLECEQKWMHYECLEKCLYRGSGVPSVALFGAGAEIKHLELQKRCLDVDIYHSNVSSLNPIEEKELLMFIEKFTSSTICAFHKSTPSGQEGDDKEKLGQITFPSPEAALKAIELNQIKFGGALLKVTPSQPTFGDHKFFPFPAVRAKVSWPRRPSKGFGILKCDPHDVDSMIDDFYNLEVGGKYVRSEASTRAADSVLIIGLDKNLSENEILADLRRHTRRRIIDFFLIRGEAVENPAPDVCGEALLKQITPFMSKNNHHSAYCRVQVFPPEPKDTFMRALVSFDGRLHLEAAKALEQIDGEVLPGCLSWQKMKCQQLFHSSLSCSERVYSVIKMQLDSLIRSFTHVKGIECSLERNPNGSYRVKISANATKTVAEVRRRVEDMLKGKIIDNKTLTPTVLQLMFSRDGINLIHTLQRETGTYIFFDRHSLNVRIFGSHSNVAVAEEKMINSLVALHESKQLQINLRGKDLPPNLLKELVNNFGPDLRGLKKKVPGADFTLNTFRHTLSIHGDKDLKPTVEEIIYKIAQMSCGSAERFDNDVTCPICLCDIEDAYQLEGCGHKFCSLCLVEQFDSAIKNQDGFPIRCGHESCGSPILLTDLRSLLPGEKLDELFRSSLGAFVASSGGVYKFCPSPDCPAIYQVADPGTAGKLFVCGSCYAETCTSCHMEYHPYLSCEKYREFKDDPDSSVKEWQSGKDNVKNCPHCGHMIEKWEGCNHIECRCGRHICWNCLELFNSSDECYNHLRNVHMTII